MDIYTRFLLRNRGDETGDTGNGTTLAAGVLSAEIEQRLHEVLGVTATEGESGESVFSPVCNHPPSALVQRLDCVQVLGLLARQLKFFVLFHCTGHCQHRVV